MEIVPKVSDFINNSNRFGGEAEFDILALPEGKETCRRPNRAYRRHVAAVFQHVGKGDSRRVAPNARARRSLHTMRAALYLIPCPTAQRSTASHRHAARRHQAHASHGGARKSGDDGDGGDGDGGEPPHHPILLDYEDLSELLKVAVGTLKNRYSQAPHTLPPAILIPGCRGPRWFLVDVIRWIEAHRVTTPAPVTQAPKRNVGRPRIAAGKGGAA